MAVKREFTGVASERQALRYAQRSNEKLRHRRQQLRQKLQHLCASFLFKEAEFAYFTKCANVLKKICKYRNIGLVSARKYQKLDNRSKIIWVQL